ncbi:MAG: glutathione S-transferase [Burkholderiaceae bacterium]
MTESSDLRARGVKWPALELRQFRLSPYNEKVRWALDALGAPHLRRSLLPGPHLPVVRRLTGQTATPILRIDENWIAGSAAILDALAQLSGAAWLHRGKDEAGQRARTIEARFDDDWVPRIRRAVLASALGDPGFMARQFAAGRPALGRALYRAILPLARERIRQGSGIRTQADVTDGEQAIGEALDFVSANLGPDGYLGGPRFGRLDLVVASHLAAVANPPDSPMSRPEPMPEATRAMLERWHDHPGSAWVREVYARHREATTDFEGLSERIR